MANVLYGELEKFLIYHNILQRQLEETKVCLNEVDYFDKISSFSEEAAFCHTLHMLPTLVVVGVNPLSKAAVVNEILGQPLLPTLGPEAEADRFAFADQNHWRSVRICYGGTSGGGRYGRMTPCVRLLKSKSASNVSNNNRETLSDDQLVPPSTLAMADSCVSLDAYLNASTNVQSDESSSSAPLTSCEGGCRTPTCLSSSTELAELQIRHPLLKNGVAEILILNYSHCTKLTLSQVFAEYSDAGILPIFLYILNDNALTPKETSDLKDMKQHLSRWPMFFIKAHSCVLSDLPESDRYVSAAEWAIVDSEEGASASEFSEASVRNNSYSTSFESVATPDDVFASPPPPVSSSKVTKTFSSNKRSLGGGTTSFFGRRSSGQNSSQILAKLAELGYLPQEKSSGKQHRSASQANLTTKTLMPAVVATEQPSGITDDSGEKNRTVDDGGSAENEEELEDDEQPLVLKPTNYWLSAGCCYVVESGRLGSELRMTNFANWTHCLDKLRSEFVEEASDLFPRLALFMRQILRSHLVVSAAFLHDIHIRLLRFFILTAFDMARDQLITPRRLCFARDKEQKLYASLLETLTQLQESLKGMVTQTIQENTERILNEAESCATDDSFELSCDFDLSSVSSVASTTSRTAAKEYNTFLQKFVFRELGRLLADRLQEAFQCLRHTFIGTIERCLSSLETTNDQRPNGEELATKAFSDMLNASYNIEITIERGSSLFLLLLEKMKQALKASPIQLTADREVSSEWKRKVAKDTLAKLNDAKLAKSICGQLRERLRVAHETFHAAMDRLDVFHQKRLIRTEDQRLKLRKEHAPRLSRLAMESLALRDSLLYGMPKLGREIGRGQYGVVYSCEKWGPFSPCAVKSVVPPDDKHWNDLAMEFFYTKNLPVHDRIVRLHGAVIDLKYGDGGSLPAVLLIMERLTRDLHTGIRIGLSFEKRIRIAIDVVEGMRFLHSQGLVHRDIKLKNVLLDDHDRGKITDLGFCKAEAMMSGSVVGTPIHMAPELFTGQYDSSVDVYAFGVLFWYVCAGHVKLPQAFEQCASKDQLWNSVRRGTRPEQLKNFDADCWDIMINCWSANPANRPFLGSIQPRLEAILERCKTNPNAK